MSKVDVVNRLFERVNARDFDAVGALHASGATFFAPGLGLDLEGRDAIVREVRAAVSEFDLRYDVHRVFEQGPFVVAFARSTGLIDGYPMGWELCGVYRFEDDQIAETWVMRGSAPHPVT